MADEAFKKWFRGYTNSEYCGTGDGEEFSDYHLADAYAAGQTAERAVMSKEYLGFRIIVDPDQKVNEIYFKNAYGKTVGAILL